jgi:hypothetical protein
MEQQLIYTAWAVCTVFAVLAIAFAGTGVYLIVTKDAGGKVRRTVAQLKSIARRQDGGFGSHRIRRSSRPVVVQAWGTTWRHCESATSTPQSRSYVMSHRTKESRRFTPVLFDRRSKMNHPYCGGRNNG